MKLKIAGGCGEHGRNCFLVETTHFSFLVDCGLMAQEDEGGYPHLIVEEIKKIKYIFLTHSHADHTGAIPWLTENGFKGTVVATKETISQLPFKLENYLTLEEAKFDDVDFQYGKTGHCVGSVWYRFEIENKSVLFSGDYTEDTYVYQFDEIKNQTADLAILDCAYGKGEASYAYYCDQIIDNVRQLKTKYETILLPVPKFGRGLELYYLLKQYFPNFSFASDAHFKSQMKNDSWIKENVKLNAAELDLYKTGCKADIVFVSNPQLRTKETQKIAFEVLKNGIGIMTGTVEEGTLSYQLIQKEKMIMCRYPVHLNYFQFNKLVQKNQFKNVIAYHSPQIDCEKEIEF